MKDFVYQLKRNDLNINRNYTQYSDKKRSLKIKEIFYILKKHRNWKCSICTFCVEANSPGELSMKNRCFTHICNKNLKFAQIDFSIISLSLIIYFLVRNSEKIRGNFARIIILVTDCFRSNTQLASKRNSPM